MLEIFENEIITLTIILRKYTYVHKYTNASKEID